MQVSLIAILELFLGTKTESRVSTLSRGDLVICCHGATDLSLLALPISEDTDMVPNTVADTQ